MEGKLGRLINNSKTMNKHCRSCNAACCGPNINIEFSNEERDFLRSVGTLMVQITDHPMVKFAQPGHNFYLMQSKCAFVINEEGIQKCGIYNNPKRPAICRQFKAGGAICKEIKALRKSGIGYQFGY